MVDWGDEALGNIHHRLERPGKNGDKRNALEKAKEGAPGIVLKPAPSQDSKKILEKVKLQAKETLEKVASPSPLTLVRETVRGRGKKKGKAGPSRERVVVDWHNTLEKDGVIPAPNQYALDRLLEKAEVFVLSWVGSKWRRNQTRTCKHYEAFSATDTTHERSGRFGKASWAHWWHCDAIFDDNNEVILDAEFQNLEVYAIQTRREKHVNLRACDVFRSFPEAVDAYLQKLENRRSKTGR